MTTTTIRVDRPFHLTLDDGQIKQFVQGDYQVEPSVADHWYVQAHSTPVIPKPEPLPEPQPLGAQPPQNPQVIPPPPVVEGDVALYTTDGTQVESSAAALLDPQTLSSAPPNANTNPNKPIATKPKK